MVHISLNNIKKIGSKVLKYERTPNHFTIHSDVFDMYFKKGYHLAPKTKNEADAAGKKNWNALCSSFVDFEVIPISNGNVIYTKIAPTRYLVGRAMLDYVGENPKMSRDSIIKRSPRMANVSLIAPLKADNEYVILGQIKGRAIGEGEIHGGSVAGNVLGEDLNSPNPLITALKRECSDELGMTLERLNPSNFYLVVDESELGALNCGAVAKNTNLDEILKTYEEITTSKIKNEEKLEVKGLALIPIVNPKLKQIKDGQLQLENITCFTPSKKGLNESIQNRKPRPYTEALIHYLNDVKNQKAFLKKASL